MSEALKEKISNDSLGKVQTYTLFSQNGILITLDLPSPVALILNNPEYYPPEANPTPKVVPVLTNQSGLDLQSATFTIQVNDVKEDTNTIVNTRWWNDSQGIGQQSMVFTCGQIANKSAGKGVAATSGYEQVRWATMTNNGYGHQTFTVSDVSLTFKSTSSVTTGATDGPIVRIG
ncbi:hypothetical protein [Pseudomonas sp. PICF141]|uniref:hypothetical protein n=1 Tax=Pseudomonas sp. PICF141 TaxID=1949067 RepID=UPI000BABA0FF|nr:hypothetical protein [Pseudomonas sp. PICF141]PAU55169.1 hypothetical protein BZL43_19105 [Pseudomonas sp. PICF141]